ncbi:MAG: hypothetical protein J6Y07_04695 [Alphaproteobacteria bacterium]|nr:hypothetical protein [Alphaproteobacteria bacterium]
MRKFMIFGLFAAFIGFAFADDIADRQTVTSLTYVNDELSEKQDIFGAQSGTKVATFTNTAGEITPREVKSDLGNNTHDTALPTVSAVNDGLDATQDTLGANKHADYVATYTNAPGELGEKGIYQDSGTYAEQQNALVDAGTFNAALQNGLDNEFVCAGNDPVTGNCWLWTIHNEPEERSQNLFDMSRIPERTNSITRNADGSITVTSTATSSAISTERTLSQLAPTIETGKAYFFEIDTTGSMKNIGLLNPDGPNVHFRQKQSTTVTQDMLGYKVVLYASGTNTTATISNIQIREVLPDTTLVPYGYTPLEYIESNGTQGIDTGVRGLDVGDWEIYVKWMITGQQDGYYPYIVGAYKSETNNAYRIILNKLSTTDYYVNGNTKAGNAKGVNNLSMNVAHEGIIRNGSVIIDGVTYQKPATGDPIPSDSSIRLFKHGSGPGIVGRIYASWAKKDSVMQYNYIPAKRNSDNEIGMYDTVSDTFKTNTGTGTLIAGPEVGNNVYLPQNQN